MAYPSSILTTYTLADNVDTVLATHPNTLSSELRAVELKLGIDSSSDASSIDYFLKNALGAFRTHRHDGGTDDGSSNLNALTGLAFLNDIDAGNYEFKSGKLVSKKYIAYDTEYDNGNSGASKTINFSNGNKQKITVDQNTSILVDNDELVGNFLLKIVSSGDYTIQILDAASNSIYWVNGLFPSLGGGNGITDIVSFYSDGTKVYASASLSFAQV